MSAILNDQMSSPGPEHVQFTKWQKIRIEPGTALAKFTDAAAMRGEGFSPWWFFLNSGPHGDGGLDQELADARKQKADLSAYIRERYAVKHEWNSLALAQPGLLRVQRLRLLKPVFAFHGPAAPVPGNAPPLAYPPRGMRDFGGGAYQLFIPNLTAAHAKSEGYFLLN